MAHNIASEEVGAAMPARPPRENLVRAVPGIHLERSTDDGMPTLTGRFAVWNQWTEIRSAYEGNFLERFSAGSMARTLEQSTPKVLFQHGKDPSVGEKPLGLPTRIAPDNEGAFYEVPLFDTSYNRDLLPGLEAGVYGASFRFSVVRENVVQKPKKSDYNPRGLPERTVEEARVMEFGPVTFPAYPGATAGVRSMTDEFLLATLERDEEVKGGSMISLIGSKFVPIKAERADSSDISCLSQMLNLGACYLSDQDEADDAADIKAMTGVLHTLTSLIDGEIDETEPDEPDDTSMESMYSAETDGEERAQWTTAYIDDLPDSAFLHIEDGGKKDGEGKTTPRSLRHFPYKDASGNVDMPHLRNALARIPQSNLPASVKEQVTAKAQRILQNHRASDSEPSGATTRGDSEAPVPTTRSTSRDLFKFTEPPQHLKENE